LAIFVVGLVGCGHAETVVHLTAPDAAWTVREPSGAAVCSLPCSVELDQHETVILHHAGGRQFIVEQDSLGAGVWTGSVRVRREPGAGALAFQAFSGALVTAGATMIDDRRRDHLAAGILLTGIGTAGMLASERMRGKRIEELWLEKISNH
jgi:hypothetical protein